MTKIISLEEQRDRLERQVATGQQPAGASLVPPPGIAAPPDLPLQDQLLFKVSGIAACSLKTASASMLNQQQMLCNIATKVYACLPLCLVSNHSWSCNALLRM